MKINSILNFKTLLNKHQEDFYNNLKSLKNVCLALVLWPNLKLKPKPGAKEHHLRVIMTYQNLVELLNLTLNIDHFFEC